MKKLGLCFALLAVVAMSLVVFSCHTKTKGSDPDDTRPKILGVTMEQGGIILDQAGTYEDPYQLYKGDPYEVTIKIEVYDPQATANDPQGSDQISRVQGGFEDPDFGNEDYQEKVDDYLGEFPGWEHTMGPINTYLARDSYLPGEIFYGLAFEGELLDGGPGMQNNFPDEVAGDGVFTIKKTRLDSKTKTSSARPWRLYFWATDFEANTSEPFGIYVRIEE